MRESDLSERVDNFNESLRWSSIKAAATFMDDTNKRGMMEKYSENFQKSRIVEYSILDTAMDPKAKTGSVLVEFSYYDNLTQQLSYRQEQQSWKLNDKKKWVITDSRVVSRSQNSATPNALTN